MTVCGVSLLKNVVLVATRKPFACAIFHRRDGLVEDAFLADRLVVALAQTVDVHDPGEVAVRGELVQVLGQQHRVRAQQHHALVGDQRVDDLLDLRVHQRLAAGDRDDGRAAFAHRLDRLLDRHPLLEQMRPAAGSCRSPAQARLQAKSGSSSSTSGNFSTPRSFCLSKYDPIRRFCRIGMAMSGHLLWQGESDVFSDGVAFVHGDRSRGRTGSARARRPGPAARRLRRSRRCGERRAADRGRARWRRR